MSFNMQKLFNKERSQMTLKRLLMPMCVLGIMFIMGNAAFAQVTCSISSVGVAVGPALALPGPTANASSSGQVEPIAAGPSGIPDSPLGTVPGTPGGGRVRVTCQNVGPAVNPGVVVLTVSVGVPITNNQTHPSTAAGVRVIQGTGDFVTCTPAAAPPGGYVGTCGPTTVNPGNVGINLISNSAGQIVIGLGTPGATVGSILVTPVVPTTGITFSAGTVAVPFVSTFELAGVLVSTAGKSGAINASLTSSGGVNIVAGTGTCPAGPGPCTQAITNVQAPLIDPTVPTGALPASVLAIPNTGPTAPIAGGAAVLNSTGAPVKSNFVIRIQEAYADMFKDASQFNGSAVFPSSSSSDTLVNVALNNIPTGFNISGCAAVLTDVNGNPPAAGFPGNPAVSATNFTAASPILTVNFNAAVDPTVIDVLWIVCTNVTSGSATLPLPSAPVTAQAYMGPVGTALSSLGAVNTSLTAGQIPRYNQVLQPTTAVTVVVFPPSNTVLLLSFAFVGPGYNTGIAVSNTTTDPYTPAGGGAAPSEGTITFLMVKNDGTTKTYTTTTGSPGGGYTGAGVVKSGSTYVVNLSDLLSAASFGTTFTGYVFISANFTNAHGAGTIYTTSTGAAALSSPVVVMPAISSAAPRPSPDAGAGLGQ